MTAFFNKNNIFYDYQFGFRSHHSTNHALLNSIDDILRWKSENFFVAGIFFDFSKAFDSIDHSILLQKIYNYGIRGSLFDWIKSYLTCRLQFTCINNVKSTYKSLEYGVPQGSVLGPLLFLLYINDIGNIPHLSNKPKLFADDTNAFIQSKNILDLKIRCQDAINEISLWVSANRLTFNTDKTCFIIFPPSLTNIDHSVFDLTLNSIPIKRVYSTKFLGMTIDHKLSWSIHIDDLGLMFRKYIGIFYKLSSFMPLKILKMLYFSLIHSKLLYGILIYANNYYSHLHDLIVYNNRLLRIIQHKSRRASVEDLYKAMGTLPVDLLFKFQLYSHAHCLFYKSPLLPTIFHNDVKQNYLVHDHDTRTRKDFHREIPLNSTSNKTSLNLCSSLWNSLPSNIKDISSLSQFKILVKDRLWCE